MLFLPACQVPLVTRYFMPFTPTAAATAVLALPTQPPPAPSPLPSFTATVSPIVTTTSLPPSLTPEPTDPLGNEDPEGKVLHAIIKGRDITATPEPDTVEDQPFEEELLMLINQERAKVGAAPLQRSLTLSLIAQEHSAQMAELDFFGHNNQDGKTFDDRIKNKGYNYSVAAENLFAGNGPYNNPEYVISTWLKSDTHRDNMLNPIYTEVGIGYRFNAATTYGGYYTADFGKP